MFSKCIQIVPLLCGSLYLTQAASSQEQPPKDQVVARVDGKPIDAKDIEVNITGVEKMFLLSKKRKPTSQELEDEVVLAKRKKLAKKIQGIIWKNALEELGIKATKDETNSEYDRIDPDFAKDPDARLKYERTYFLNLAQALKEVLENPKEAESVYKQRMKDRMPYGTWCAIVKYENNHEYIANLERSIPSKTEDIYKMAQLEMTFLVESKKFREAITKDVVVIDDEIRQSFETQYVHAKDKPSFVEMKHEIGKKLLEKKRNAKEKEWWLERYKKTRIEIADLPWARDLTNEALCSQWFSSRSN
jgi:hypothetical protein